MLYLNCLFLKIKFFYFNISKHKKVINSYLNCLFLFFIDVFFVISLYITFLKNKYFFIYFFIQTFFSKTQIKKSFRRFKRKQLFKFKWFLLKLFLVFILILIYCYCYLKRIFLYSSFKIFFKNLYIYIYYFISLLNRFLLIIFWIFFFLFCLFGGMVDTCDLKSHPYGYKFKSFNRFFWLPALDFILVYFYFI